MTCTKLISMTGYLVRYVDLREPKPRAIHESVYVMEKDALAALGLMGLNVLEFITTRFQRGGYLVIGIESAKPKRVAEIDLCQLWEQSAPVANEEAAATPDSEVRPE
ncbi:MAG: hypothetical protein MR636_08925 [Clostridiales bacterium]|nr:hypothetical protein [Clostridiales bacterium]